MIPSAVVIPQPEERRPRNGSASSTLKRKLSHPLDHDRKRPRIDNSADTDSLNYDEVKHSPPSSKSTQSQTQPRSATATGSTTATTTTSRRSSTIDTGTGAAVEEKKRSRRLFGGLLGVVSGSTARSNPAHKKRDEIEARARERLKKENEEAEADRRRRRTEIEASREREQRRWDEEGREVRWRNMRRMARFLRTRCEPMLYYRPWEFRVEEEEVVERQKREVEEVIRREGGLAEGVGEAAQTGLDAQPGQDGPGRKNRDQEDLQEGVKVEEQTLQPTSGPEQAQANGHSQDQGDDEKQEIEQQPPTDNDAVVTQGSVPDIKAEQSAPTNGPEDNPGDEDHHDGELVEGQEDDVIY